jgi:hypothetical protein
VRGLEKRLAQLCRSRAAKVQWCLLRTLGLREGLCACSRSHRRIVASEHAVNRIMPGCRLRCVPVHSLDDARWRGAWAGTRLRWRRIDPWAGARQGLLARLVLDLELAQAMARTDQCQGAKPR